MRTMIVLLLTFLIGLFASPSKGGSVVTPTLPKVGYVRVMSHNEARDCIRFIRLQSRATNQVVTNNSLFRPCRGSSTCHLDSS